MSKIIRLYLRPAAAYGILPVLCALLLSAESFCQGDSAEELCAALLAVTLYTPWPISGNIRAVPCPTAFY